MATFYRSTRLWTVDFQYDGRSRRWVVALPATTDDGRAVFAGRLAELYGARARLLEARLSTPEEELQFIAGTLPRNVYCPVLRHAPPAGSAEPGATPFRETGPKSPPK